MSAVVAACDLSYAVAGRFLVRDANLSMLPGKVHVVIGPNGAGKSTLLKLMTGELRPHAGSVMMGELPLPGLPPSRLACMRAVMTQSARLAFPFSAMDVVHLGCDGIGRAQPRAIRAAMIARALEAVEMSHLAERDYQTLSGGEQQRIQFARVLCQLEAGRTIAPVQALFLDEPVASLDLRHQLAIMAMARQLAARGIAVLVVLHDINLAATYADTLTIMAGGRIVAQGPVPETLTEPVLAEVFGVSIPFLDSGLAGRPCVIPQRWERAPGHALHGIADGPPEHR